MKTCSNCRYFPDDRKKELVFICEKSGYMISMNNGELTLRFGGEYYLFKNIPHQINSPYYNYYYCPKFSLSFESLLEQIMEEEDAS